MSKKYFCPACDSSQNSFCGDKNDFKIFTCQECKTLFSTKNKLSERFDYDDYYHQNNLVAPDFINFRLDEIVSSFESFRLNNRFLDVGCGAGNLLAAAARVNWQIEGVEVSKSSVEFLQKQKIQVFHGELFAANFQENSFDVVAAVEILEHISEPAKFLKEVFRILRPGGLFFATTPHGAGASAKLLAANWTCVAPPEHLHLFSFKGMKYLLKEAGFEQAEVLTQGVNPFEIIHELRSKSSFLQNQKTSNNKKFSRVETSYELNRLLSSSPSRKLIKNILNTALNIAKLGDSLKVRAIK